MHCLCEVAFFCFLLNQAKVLYSCSVVVVLFKGCIHGFAALNLVCHALKVVVVSSEVENLLTGACILRDDASCEEEAIKRLDAAEGNVELSWCKNAFAEVEDHLVEGCTLTFMDGDCPGQFQRVLSEGSLNLFLELLGFAVILIGIGLP